jgi:hypothetical protein
LSYIYKILYYFFLILYYLTYFYFLFKQIIHKLIFKLHTKDVIG